MKADKIGGNLARDNTEITDWLNIHQYPNE